MGSVEYYAHLLPSKESNILNRKGDPLPSDPPLVLPTPSSVTLDTYPTTAAGLWQAWGVLLSFGLGFLVITRFVLDRDESF